MEDTNITLRRYVQIYLLRGNPTSKTAKITVISYIL